MQNIDILPMVESDNLLLIIISLKFYPMTNAVICSKSLTMDSSTTANLNHL